MDIVDALNKDLEFKDKVHAAIAAKAQLDAGLIGKSDRCMLGNWLHGDGERKYPLMKSFRPCVDAHTAFHQQAAKIVRQLNLGEYQQVESMLADGTPFAAALADLRMKVALLKRDARI